MNILEIKNLWNMGQTMKKNNSNKNAIKIIKIGQKPYK